MDGVESVFGFGAGEGIPPPRASECNQADRSEMSWEALEISKKRKDIAFVIAGPDEGMEIKVREIIKDSSNIHLIGALKEKKDIFTVRDATRDLNYNLILCTNYFNLLYDLNYLKKERAGSICLFTPVSEEKIKELYDIAYKYYKEKKDDSNGIIS